MCNYITELKLLTRINCNILFLENIIKTVNLPARLHSILTADIRELNKDKNNIKIGIEYKKLDYAIKNK